MLNWGQPIKPTAIAKLAGNEMCRSYQQQYVFDCISVIPVNVVVETLAPKILMLPSHIRRVTIRGRAEAALHTDIGAGPATGNSCTWMI